MLSLQRRGALRGTRRVGARSAIGGSAHAPVCGRSHRIVSAQRVHTVRSAPIVEYGAEESFAVQCCGVAPGRLLGCGLFVPHKDIGPVRRLPGDG